jgi:hypothetical protein
VVSAVLSRKRQINARQAHALGKRFSVSAAAFIGAGEPAFQSARTVVTQGNVVGSVGSETHFTTSGPSITAVLHWVEFSTGRGLQ